MFEHSTFYLVQGDCRSIVIVALIHDDLAVDWHQKLQNLQAEQNTSHPSGMTTQHEQPTASSLSPLVSQYSDGKHGPLIDYLHRKMVIVH